jgi:hypothetical protein
MANALTSLQAEIERELALLRDIAPPPASNRIAVTQQKQFKFPDGRLTTDPIQAVILDYRYFNAYYAAAFNPASREKPLCYSVNSDSRIMVPDEAASQKQCDSCAGCPKNEFGSAGRGKACKNNIRLAVVAPDATEDTVPWILTVSPTGLKHFNAYLNNLVQVHGKVLWQVITTIGFDPKETYATLRFAIGGINENELVLKMKAAAQPALDRTFE